MTAGRPARGTPLNICRGGQAQVAHQPVTYYGAACPVCERQQRVDSLLKELATLCAGCMKGKPTV